MVDVTFYLVTQEIAQRSGVIESRYRIKDGRFVLDNKDLSYIRLTPDEYIDGLKGVEKVSKNEAMLLIEENGYKMGIEKPIVVPEQPQVEDAAEENSNNQENENNKQENEEE